MTVVVELSSDITEDLVVELPNGVASWSIELLRPVYSEGTWRRLLTVYQTLTDKPVSGYGVLRIWRPRP